MSCCGKRLSGSWLRRFAACLWGFRADALSIVAVTATYLNVVGQAVTVSWAAFGLAAGAAVATLALVPILVAAALQDRRLRRLECELLASWADLPPSLRGRLAGHLADQPGPDRKLSG